jgi:hypothetical protein
MVVGLGEKVELEVLVPFPWLEPCQVGFCRLESLIRKGFSVLTAKCQHRENTAKVPENGTIGLSLGTLG